MRTEGIRVSRGHVEVLLAFDPNAPLRTSEVSDLVGNVTRLLPGLSRHRCTSPASGLLASEITDTEIAHLLEHMVLEIMVLAGSPRTLSGRTTWDFARDGRGVFRLAIEYDDEAVGVGAARCALDVLTALLRGEEPPNVSVVVSRLADEREEAAPSL